MHEKIYVEYTRATEREREKVNEKETIARRADGILRVTGYFEYSKDDMYEE